MRAVPGGVGQGREGVWGDPGRLSWLPSYSLGRAGVSAKKRHPEKVFLGKGPGWVFRAEQRKKQPAGPEGWTSGREAPAGTCCRDPGPSEAGVCLRIGCVGFTRF